MGFTSCGRTLGIPLELQWGPQGPTRVVSGKLILHSSWEGPLGIPLQSVQGHRASSRVEFGTSGFLFSSDMDLGLPMEIQQGSQASSLVETWNAASFLKCKRSVRLSVVWTQGSGTISLGARAVTPPLVFWVDPRVPVKSMQGNQAYLEWLVKLGFFELRRDSWGCAPV